MGLLHFNGTLYRIYILGKLPIIGAFKMNVRDRWNEGKLLGLNEEQCLKLFGPLPAPTKTDIVNAFTDDKALAVMKEALTIYKDFKNENRSILDYTFNLCRSHWLIKGKQARPIEGQVFVRKWEVMPSPTDAELLASWKACKESSKSAIFRAVEKNGKFSPMGEKLAANAPMDVKGIAR